MNPIIRHFQNDGYPAISFTQANTAIGSFGRDTRLRIGTSGGAFVCQNTAPPYDTQINLYSQTAISVQPEFAGTDAEVAVAIAENYEWRLSSLVQMTVSGVAADTWNAFNASGLDAASFLINDPITDPPSYRLRIREKASGVEVAIFRYQLDGF